MIWTTARTRDSTTIPKSKRSGFSVLSFFMGFVFGSETTNLIRLYFEYTHNGMSAIQITTQTQSKQSKTKIKTIQNHINR